jgi:hypothetical protein
VEGLGVVALVEGLGVVALVEGVLLFGQRLVRFGLVLLQAKVNVHHELVDQVGFVLGSLFLLIQTFLHVVSLFVYFLQKQVRLLFSLQ